MLLSENEHDIDVGRRQLQRKKYSRLKKLDTEDAVSIYYASDNKYFTNKERQSEIIKTANCNVNFLKISAADNAVDFAIAMDMRALIENCPSELIILVSEDRHFETIIKRTKEVIHCNNLFLASNIEDATKRFGLIGSKDLDLIQLHNCLIRSYGQEKGNELYTRIDALFEQKYRITKSSDSLSSANRKLQKTYLASILGALLSLFRRKGKR